MYKTGLLSIAAIVAIAASLATPDVQAGQTYYRWKDQQGRFVHSDRPPPPGIEYEVISSGSSNLVRRVGAEEGAVPATTEPSPGNEFEPTQREMGVVERNPEICARARENLETLQNAARIRMRDDQGEYYFLSEEEKEIQMEKARDLISVHCE